MVDFDFMAAEQAQEIAGKSLANISEIRKIEFQGN